MLSGTGDSMTRRNPISMKGPVCKPVNLILHSVIVAFLLLGAAPSIYADTLRVGILKSAQMGYATEDGKIKGFEAELAQLICERIQSHCQLVIQPFSKNLAEVRSGALDLALSSILVTPEREKNLSFSAPYMRSVSAYIGNPDTQPKYRPIRVAVISASVQQRYLEKNHSETMIAMPYQNIRETFESLRQGEVDRVLLPAIIQLNFLSENQDNRFELLGEPLEHPMLSGEVAVALPHKNKPLITKINRAISQLLIDGSFNALNNKYFPFNIY